MLSIQESIRPSADLRNHYNEISKQCKENKEAVIITVNGRGDTVSLSYEEYKNMKARIELLEVLAEAEDDVKNGRVAPISDTFDDLRKMFQEGEVMKYEVIRTDTADAGIRKIILYIAQNFGNTVALEKLDDIEKRILQLGEDPYIGTNPRYSILRRQGYKVLILEKNLVFYKIDEVNKQVVVYAVIDQRQDYLNIIQGL